MLFYRVLCETDDRLRLKNLTLDCNSNHIKICSHYIFSAISELDLFLPIKYPHAICRAKSVEKIWAGRS